MSHISREGWCEDIPLSLCRKTLEQKHDDIKQQQQCIIKPKHTMESTRNLALILAVHAGSAFAAEEKSPSSFRQVAVSLIILVYELNMRCDRNRRTV